MDWIINLFTNTESVAHIALLYAIVIAIGVYLGKIKIFGISLGVTFVLFAGILAGHVGFTGPKEILTFGPVCVLPEYQRMGYGKVLMEYSFEQAKKLGYDTIVIFGSPANYVSRGFVSCKKHNVSLENGKYPAAMLVKELIPGALSGKKWIYHDSPVMAISEQDAQAYDDSLEPMEKKWMRTIMRICVCS